MFKKIALLILALPACTPTAVTEYNGHSIRIQSVSYMVDAEAISEAQRICGVQGLQAEYASTTSSPISYFTHYHLFLCLPQARPNAGLPQPNMRRPGYLETTSTL